MCPTTFTAGVKPFYHRRRFREVVARVVPVVVLVVVALPEVVVVLEEVEVDATVPAQTYTPSC
jgi:hypothetical protein